MKIAQIAVQNELNFGSQLTETKIGFKFEVE